MHGSSVPQQTQRRIVSNTTVPKLKYGHQRHSSRRSKSSVPRQCRSTFTQSCSTCCSSPIFTQLKKVYGKFCQWITVTLIIKKFPYTFITTAACSLQSLVGSHVGDSTSRRLWPFPYKSFPFINLVIWCYILLILTISLHNQLRKLAAYNTLLHTHYFL